MKDYKKIAIELGQTLISKAPETREDVERMLPELKESEDERIRKQLIEHIKWSYDEQEISEEEKERWISWLEKQGEQKLANSAKTCKDEQKPDKVEPKFKAGDRVIGIVSGIQYYITEVRDDYYCTESGCIIMFNAQDNFELSEQKPAWSEEDEEMLNVVMQSCEKCGNEYAYYWLKSLKDRVQPKQEWSEEDEEEANYIADFIENLIKKEKLVSKKTMIMKEMVDWLRSLRPPYYCDNCKLKKSIQGWKPSDEQMEVLKILVDTSKGFDHSKILESLYKDLKKLREG